MGIPCTPACLPLIKESWNSEICVALNGDMPSWDNVDMRIETPDQFRKIYDGKNALHEAKCIADLVAKNMPAIGNGAEDLAKAMEERDAPSASEIKTITVSQNKEPLTSTLTAVIGKACRKTGHYFLTVTGKLLKNNSKLGLRLSDHYLGELKEFDIVCKERGNRSKPAILFINGFLQEGVGIKDWLEAVAKKFPDNPKYHVNWDSENIQLLLKKIIPQITSSLKSWHEHSETIGETANKENEILSNILTNPWHTAFNNAGKTGGLLAEIIARTTAHEQYIIMGHSLGCRVAYYAARALATKKEKRIDSLYLLSGAVGVDGWEEISENVNNIYNFYAPDDVVVGRIYKSASFGIAEDTIGIKEIAYKADNIHNTDVTDIIKKHDASLLKDKLFYHIRYKDFFDVILDEYLKSQKS